MESSKSSYDRENRIFKAAQKDGSSKKYYLSEKALGKGAFGEVFEAMSEDGEKVVLKISRIKTWDAEQDLQKEVENFSQLYKSVSVDPVVRDGRQLISILPRIDGSEALNLEKRQNLEAPVSHMMYSLVGLYSQLQQLHNNNIIHGDIKLENVMLTEFKSISGVPGIDYSVPVFSLVDLGLASTVEFGESKFTGQRGTLSTMAPEVKNRGCSYFASDIFSSTQILMTLMGANGRKTEMLTRSKDGNRLVKSNKDESSFFRRINHEINSKVKGLNRLMPKGIRIQSLDFASICKLMLDPEPYARPTATELVTLFNALQNYYATAETLSRYSGAISDYGDVNRAISKSQLRDQASIAVMLSQSPQTLRMQYVDVCWREQMDLLTDEFMRELQKFSNPSKEQNISEIKKNLERILGKKINSYQKGITVKRCMQLAKNLGGQGKAINVDNLEKEFRKIFEAEIDGVLKNKSKNEDKYDDCLENLAFKLEEKSRQEILKEITNSNESISQGSLDMGQAYSELLKTKLKDGWDLIEKLQSDLNKKVARDGLERVVYEHENRDQIATVGQYKKEMKALEGSESSGLLVSNIQHTKQRNLKEKYGKALKAQQVSINDKYTLDDYVKDLEGSAPTKYSERCSENIMKEKMFYETILEANPVKEKKVHEKLLDKITSKNKRKGGMQLANLEPLSSFSFVDKMRGRVSEGSNKEDNKSLFRHYETKVLERVLSFVTCLGEEPLKNYFTDNPDLQDVSYEEKFAKLKDKSKEIFRGLLKGLESPDESTKKRSKKSLKEFIKNFSGGVNEISIYLNSLDNYATLSDPNKSVPERNRAYEDVKNFRKRHTQVKTHRKRKRITEFKSKTKGDWELDVKSDTLDEFRTRLGKVFDSALDQVKLHYESNIVRASGLNTWERGAFAVNLREVQEHSQERLGELKKAEKVLEVHEKSKQVVSQKHEQSSTIIDEKAPMKFNSLRGG